MAKKQNSNVVDIDISIVFPNPLNPRKHFDEDAIRELSESIKEIGILQPVVVRPIGDRYQIVCGERRYRASLLAGLKTITSIVKDLTDDAALSAMITENLQRRDISPIEEADAYEMMKSKLKLSIHEIASKLGISPGYVTRRLKLASLIPDFKNLIDEKKIDIGIAIEISKMPDDVQNQLLEEYGTGYRYNFQSLSRIKEHIKSEFMGDLSAAKFDIEDPNLTAAGSCIGCPFNTASQTLLFDDLTEARCTKHACFNEKTSLAFQQKIEAVVNQESDILIGASSYLLNSPEVKALNSKAAIVDLSAYSEIEKPEPPEMPMRDEDDSEEDYQELLEEYKEEYEDYLAQLKVYEEQMENPDKIKILKVAGSRKGEVSYYLPDNTSDPSAPSVTADPVQLEIIKIEEKIKRADEIADEKIFGGLIQLAEKNEYWKEKAELKSIEKAALMLILLDQAGYTYRDELSEMLQLDRDQFYKTSSEEKYQKVLALDPEQVNLLIRAFIHQTTFSGDPKLVKGRVRMAKEIMINFYQEEYLQMAMPIKEKSEQKKASLEKQLEKLQQPSQ